MLREIFTIDAGMRLSPNLGTGASRRLRAKNKIPAVVYGLGKETQSVLLDSNTINKFLKKNTFYTSILTMRYTDVDEEQQVVLKAVKRHPYKNCILHLDFQRISEKEKITIRVPLTFVGESVSPGIKIGGGVVLHLLSELDVRCLPKDIPDQITIDISKMEINDMLHLSDLPLPEGVEIVDLIHGNNKSVVAVRIPKVIEEEVAAPVVTAADGAAPVDDATTDAATTTTTDTKGGADATADQEGKKQPQAKKEKDKDKKDKRDKK